MSVCPKINIRRKNEGIKMGFVEVARLFFIFKGVYKLMKFRLYLVLALFLLDLFLLPLVLDMPNYLKACGLKTGVV